MYLVALRGPAFPAPRGLCAGNHHSPARVRPAPAASPARSPHVGQPPRALPPPPHTRPGSPDAGAAEVPGPPPGLRASPRDGRGIQVAESRAAGWRLGAASHRDGQGVRAELDGRRPVPGDQPPLRAPPPRAPPAQCSCARPSLYSGRGSRAFRTWAQPGGPDSAAEPPASGAGVRVPDACLFVSSLCRSQLVCLQSAPSSWSGVASRL